MASHAPLWQVQAPRRLRVRHRGRGPPRRRQRLPRARGPARDRRAPHGLRRPHGDALLRPSPRAAGPALRALRALRLGARPRRPAALVRGNRRVAQVLPVGAAAAPAGPPRGALPQVVLPGRLPARVEGLRPRPARRPRPVLALRDLAGDPRRRARAPAPERPPRRLRPREGRHGHAGVGALARLHELRLLPRPLRRQRPRPRRAPRGARGVHGARRGGDGPVGLARAALREPAQGLELPRRPAPLCARRTRARARRTS